MNRREQEDQRIQNRRSPPVPNLSDVDAAEDSMSIKELLGKLVQLSMGALAGVLTGFFLGSAPGVLGLVVYGDLAGLMLAYWGVLLGMAAGAIIFGVIVWNDPN